MSDVNTELRKGHDFKGSRAEGHAKQQNGDQIYGTVQSVHHGDTYNTTQNGPVHVARSGYLSPQRWIDEPKNNAALIEASTYGQVQRLAFLLNQPDKNVDYIDKSGLGALHYAVRNGHTEAIRMLIAQGGANPGLQDTNRKGPTPLIYAAQRGLCKAATILLEAGAPIDSSYSRLYGDRLVTTTALGQAILCGHSTVVSLLLSHGASTKQDAGPETRALTLAMLVGRHDIVNLLLENGATLEWLNHVRIDYHDGKLLGGKPYCGELSDSYWIHSPLTWAVLLDDKAKLLNIVARQGTLRLLEEAFHLAALMDNVEAMDCLLASGVDVNCEYRGRRALHLVSFFGITGSIDHLLERGANINQFDSDVRHDDAAWDDSWPAWDWQDWLEFRGSPRARTFVLHRVRTCIRDPNANSFVSIPVISKDCEIPGRIGYQAIHYAVGSHRALEHLVACGADVNATISETSCTALHVAAALLDADSARWLLTHGAPFPTGSPEGCSPYDIALKQDAVIGDEQRRKRELLDMMRLIPIHDFKRVVQLDYAWKPRPRERDAIENDGRQERSSNSSWALSERYSANSWALSERYSIRSQANSKIYDIEEIVEENGTHGELGRTSSKEGTKHESTDKLAELSLEEVPELVEPSDERQPSHMTYPEGSEAQQYVPATASSKRYSRFFFD